ncbi:hypothetical protein FQA39_LY00591 [Lamprigera yunnana]|nr:hypothetical protein FQA39_LY00591 [Lamprigera yunnana]
MKEPKEACKQNLIHEYFKGNNNLLVIVTETCPLCSLDKYINKVELYLIKFRVYFIIKMPLYEEEQTKLLRLHEVLEEIPSDPESEDDEEHAAATHDILGTYVLDVNNYLVPCTNDDNNVGLTTYDNLNSD